MTLEEAQAKITELEGKLTDATNARNTNALRGHALAAVLKAHNIGFSIDEADLSALSVGEDGAVTGELAYTAPAVQQQQQQTQTQQAEGEQQQQQQGLTIEDVKAMSEDQINERWDEVSAVLEAQKAEE